MDLLALLEAVKVMEGDLYDLRDCARDSGGTVSLLMAANAYLRVWLLRRNLETLITP